MQAQVPGLLTPSKCGRQVFGRYDDGSVSVHNTGTMDIGVGLVVELCGVAKGRSPLIKGEFITRFFVDYSFMNLFIFLLFTFGAAVRSMTADFFFVLSLPLEIIDKLLKI